MTEKKLVPELRFPEFGDEYNIAKIENEFDFIKKYSYSRRDEGEGIYFHIHYGDIHSKYIGSIDKNTQVPSIQNMDKHEEIEYGDIIVADASEDYEDLGKSVVLMDKSNRKFIAGLHTFALRGKDNINPLYFLNYTKTQRYKKYMAKIGTGTSVFGITQANFRKLEFPLPSIKEQNKIASFLRAIDKKIELQEELIEKLEEQKKGLMQKIFNQEVRFKGENGNNYSEWEEKRLGEFTKVITSNLRLKDLNSKGETPVYDVSNKVGYIDKKGVDKDYISIIKDGSGVGRVSLLPKGSFFIATMNGIYVDKQNIYFVYLILKQFIFLKYIVGSGIPHIYYKDYSNEKIELPVIEEQKKISNFLSLADKRIDLEKEQLENYKEYKKGLMQRMFI